MHSVWLNPGLFQLHKDSLSNGVPVSYSYGFSEVTIAPVSDCVVS